MKAFVAISAVTLVLAAGAAAASKPGGVGAYYVAKGAVAVVDNHPSCRDRLSRRSGLDTYRALKKLSAASPIRSKVPQVLLLTIKLAKQIAADC
jgi:hypothetical protein